MAIFAAVTGVVLATAPQLIGVKAADKNSEGHEGIVMFSSAYGFGETVERLKGDIAAKGILFFSQIDQARLAADAGIKLNPSTLLVFGNPPLGTLFITANPLAGLDWPVRLLVYESTDGKVWVAYTDFASIAKRHGITTRDVEFKMASGVIASITGSVMLK
ncbi:MAG: DUF302 domain-containing protein [Hyphomicrobiaceae bacterium]